ncbi:MAG: hypothetical protein MR935_00960 [Agathobaculum sp.]|uniref:hypothetical protein n=1 Tax=Agathobaculum sp. TaxID=2048138 RepID=UPI0025BF1988|nr:hypothetical protein [Agathobaculum sp.]MCI7124763.1 hypothetical protein [Agathobaculum sp.]MDY3711743.1 hypothetical protein [Agathobaculum sp.]
MSDSKVISDFLDALKQLLAALKGKRRLSDYIEAAEKAADQEINRTLASGKIKYMGGKCFFTWDNIGKEVIGEITLYFVRNGEEYCQKSMVQKIHMDDLDVSDVVNIQKAGQLVFDILPPQNLIKDKEDDLS